MTVEVDQRLRLRLALSYTDELPTGIGDCFKSTESAEIEGWSYTDELPTGIGDIGAITWVLLFAHVLHGRIADRHW